MDWLVQGADYVVWRRLAELAEDRAMVARLDAMHAAQQSGCKTSIPLSGGGETNAPLMLVAEAAVAAQEGVRQREWRENWVRALVGMAVGEQDQTTTDGVVATLTAMDTVITDMKIARVWPWLARKKKVAKAEGETTKGESDDAEGGAESAS